MSRLIFEKAPELNARPKEEAPVLKARPKTELKAAMTNQQQAMFFSDPKPYIVVDTTFELPEDKGAQVNSSVEQDCNLNLN